MQRLFFCDKIFPGFPSFGLSIRTQGGDGDGATQSRLFASGEIFLSVLCQKIQTVSPMLSQAGEVTEENEKDSGDSGEVETKV